MTPIRSEPATATPLDVDRALDLLDAIDRLKARLRDENTPSNLRLDILRALPQRRDELLRLVTPHLRELLTREA